ncbi:hypothetical protein [Vibrio alfacsensis]|uniref:hypothetical protein n=1 Tax=Vibrio alfacsensis TaxID=1074311 RepID=UPI004067887E
MTFAPLCRHALALLIIALLSACGGEDSASGGSEPVPPPTLTPQTLTALSGLNTAAIHQPMTMDLSPFILGEQADTQLQMDNLNAEHCPDPEINGLRFSLTLSKAGWCDYRYSVFGRDGEQDEAIVTLVTSTAADPMLPVISVATTADIGSRSGSRDGSERQAIAIDLLGHYGPLGYTLVEERLAVQAPPGTQKGTISANGDGSISYNAPSSYGWNYIQYALTKTLKNGQTDTRVGYVFITLSDSVNTPPSITPEIWHYPRSVKPGESLTIQLDQLQGLGLAITDSGDWQLAGVSAMGADVASLEPDNVFNKAFTFSAAKDDQYDVSYIVADHENGFTLGIMQISVDSNEANKSWNEIGIDQAYYSAPLLASEVPDNIAWGGNALTETITVDGEDKQYQVALWTPSEAETYCASFSPARRLPTSAEMATLKSTSSVDAERNKWPRAMSYLTKDDGSYNEVDLATSAAKRLSDTAQRYVTCYKQPPTPVTLTIAQSAYSALVDAPMNVSVNKKDADGVGVAGMRVSIIDSTPTDTIWTLTRGGQTAALPSPELSLPDVSTAVVTVSANQAATAKIQLASIGAGVGDATQSSLTVTESPFIRVCGAVGDNSGIDSTMDYLSSDNCLKVVSDGDPVSGKLFAASPSEEVMKSLGYVIKHSADNKDCATCNDGKTYASFNATDPASEDGLTGFATFRQDGGAADGSNGQADRWCQQLNNLQAAGRSDWQRASIAQLSTLGYRISRESRNFGWPGFKQLIRQWSSERSDNENHFEYVRLATGAHDANQNEGLLTTCVSLTDAPTEPEFGICGGKVNDDVNNSPEDFQTNAIGNCLKVSSAIHNDKGYWFTSTPSQAVMTELGYTEATGTSTINGGKTYFGLQAEHGSTGPNGGNFAMFDQQGGDSEGINGQYDRWCNDLAAMSFAGTDQWQRPGRAQLRALANTYQDGTQFDGLWHKHGWPAMWGYWSKTKASDVPTYYARSLSDSNVESPQGATTPLYASCMALMPTEPEPTLGICGGVVDDADKANATGFCLKVATDNSGNWFSSSPSKAVMDGLGYVLKPDSSSTDSGKTYNVLHTEDGSTGPSGEFARFDATGGSYPEGTKNQYDRWCTDLANMNFAEKRTWRRATADELIGLQNKYVKNLGSSFRSEWQTLWTSHGWPTWSYHATSTPRSYNTYKWISLKDNEQDTNAIARNLPHYASCIAPTETPPEPSGCFDNEHFKQLNVGMSTKRYVSTPPQAVVDCLKFTEYGGAQVEAGDKGPADVSFALFTQPQAGSWCEKLNSSQFEGRTNWHLPSNLELDSLQENYGSLWTNHGWAVTNLYWTSEHGKRRGLGAWSIGVGDGQVNEPVYASCVSDN